MVPLTIVSLTHSKVVAEPNNHRAGGLSLTMASSCLFGTLREYFLKRSHFGNSRTVD